MFAPDGKVKIPGHLPSSTIMNNPQWVKAGVEYYFNTHPFHDLFTHQPAATNASKGKDSTSQLVSLPKKTVFAAMPTPESYAHSLGFSGFAQLKRALDNPDYSEESKYYITIGCSIIADLLTRAGLTDKMPTSFVKFIMSAYLDINEKAELHKTEDNRITIAWGQPMLTPTGEKTNTLQALSHDTSHLIEMERLESALPEGMRMYTSSSTSVNKTTRDLNVSDIM